MPLTEDDPVYCGTCTHWHSPRDEHIWDDEGNLMENTGTLTSGELMERGELSDGTNEYSQANPIPKDETYRQRIARQAKEACTQCGGNRMRDLHDPTCPFYGPAGLDFRKELGMIRDYAGLAQGALQDEHEGNFKYYVDIVALLSDRLNHAARTM